ncbi:MAG: PLP-dependent aminotransferase family protein [Cyclobacteriaceae bacterium]
MLPLQTMIKIDFKSSIPVYMQLANGISSLISDGTLAPNAKLPSSRRLAAIMELNRNTVVRSIDELQIQGWIKVIPSRGAHVNGDIPEFVPKPLISKGLSMIADQASFGYKRTGLNWYESDSAIPVKVKVDEGIPDVRIAPINEFRRTFSAVLSRNSGLKLLNYGDAQGNIDLRRTLVGYLRHTRGLKFSEQQILITRGSQMGIYLAATLMLEKGDKVGVGQLNYTTANQTMKFVGGKLIDLRHDEEGLDISHLTTMCEKHRMKMVYVTPHHHHPTTAMMSAERRIRLLNLARKHNFCVLEDDYDYDFHYKRSPRLPLASMDTSGHVIYIGSICKLMAPGVRVGYMIGPTDFIKEATLLRRVLDRQGEQAIEYSLSQMIKNGDLQRHSRKAIKIYHERRDRLVEILNNAKLFEFTTPEGGMAIWVKLKADYSWGVLTEALMKRGVAIPDWRTFDSKNIGHKGMRLGFASLNEQEMQYFGTQLIEVANDLT